MLPEDAGFTEQEKWAWNMQLCLGEIANMSDYGDGGDEGCDPKDVDAWPDARRLSEDFLSTILFHEPYKIAPPRPQIRIRCALFVDEINLSGLDLGDGLRLGESRFKQRVNLGSLTARRSLAFTGSVFEDGLSLAGAEIGGELDVRGATVTGFDAYGLSVRRDMYLSSVSFEREVSLFNAKIGGQLLARDATFEGELDADGLEVNGDLFLDARFTDEVSLSDAKIGGQLLASGATFEGGLYADGLEVNGDLFLNAQFTNEVNLSDAKIGGQLLASGATFEGGLYADGLEVNGDLFLNAQFTNEVNLSDAKIGGQLLASDGTFEGGLYADGLEVNGDLFLNAQFTNEVNLSDAKIGGQLLARGATFEGLYADGLEVNGDLFLDDGADFRGPIDILGAVVEGNVHLYGSTFHQRVDFTATTITGDLKLASGLADPKQPTWNDDSKLILRDVSVGSFQVSRSAWCKEGMQDTCDNNNSRGFVPIDLKGFTVERLRGLELTNPDPFTARETDWLLAWLGAQLDLASAYDPLPFTQLAAVLRDAGQPEKADEILFQRREHERKASNTPWWAKLWLTLQWILTGYGYSNGRALTAFAGLVLVGAWACKMANETMKMKPGHKLWYSLDYAIPIVSLGAGEGIDPPSNWVGYYFYFHRVVGVVLTPVIVAGLSGFTK